MAILKQVFSLKGDILTGSGEKKCILKSLILLTLTRFLLPKASKSS